MEITIIAINPFVGLFPLVCAPLLVFIDLAILQLGREVEVNFSKTNSKENGFCLRARPRIAIQIKFVKRHN